MPFLFAFLSLRKSVSYAMLIKRGKINGIFNFFAAGIGGMCHGCISQSSFYDSRSMDADMGCDRPHTVPLVQKERLFCSTTKSMDKYRNTMGAYFILVSHWRLPGLRHHSTRPLGPFIVWLKSRSKGTSRSNCLGGRLPYVGYLHAIPRRFCKITQKVFFYLENRKKIVAK